MLGRCTLSADVDRSNFARSLQHGCSQQNVSPSLTHLPTVKSHGLTTDRLQPWFTVWVGARTQNHSQVRLEHEKNQQQNFFENTKKFFFPATMQAAQQEVAQCERNVEEAQRKLSTARAQLQESQNFVLKDVKEQLKSQRYANQQSEAIRVSGPTFKPPRVLETGGFWPASQPVSNRRPETETPASQFLKFSMSACKVWGVQGSSIPVSADPGAPTPTTCTARTALSRGCSQVATLPRKRALWRRLFQGDESAGCEGPCHMRSCSCLMQH